MGKREDEKKRLDGFPDVQKDPRPHKTGVLLSDEIELHVAEGRLIDPFVKNNLKPAGYELTVGDQAMKGGKFIRLDGVDSDVRIPPFEVVVVKTAETINLPRFLIARWNIRVKWAYEGLLWVGGPQVDPGYVGNLFCPLYNLSNETVKLKKGEAIALIDFVKTTGIEREEDFLNSNIVKYRRPPKRVFIEDFGIEGFRSALHAKDVDVREGLEQVKRKVDVFSSLVLGILAILITAITVPYLAERTPKIHGEVYEALPFVVSVLALLFSFFAWWLVPRNGWVRWLHVGLAVVIGVVVGWFAMGSG